MCNVASAVSLAMYSPPPTVAKSMRHGVVSSGSDREVARHYGSQRQLGGRIDPEVAKPVSIWIVKRFQHEVLGLLAVDRFVSGVRNRVVVLRRHHDSDRFQSRTLRSRLGVDFDRGARDAERVVRSQERNAEQIFDLLRRRQILGVRYRLPRHAVPAAQRHRKREVEAVRVRRMGLLFGGDGLYAQLAGLWKVSCAIPVAARFRTVRSAYDDGIVDLLRVTRRRDGGAYPRELRIRVVRGRDHSRTGTG